MRVRSQSRHRCTVHCSANPNTLTPLFSIQQPIPRYPAIPSLSAPSRRQANIATSTLSDSGNSSVSPSASSSNSSEQGDSAIRSCPNLVLSLRGLHPAKYCFSNLSFSSAMYQTACKPIHRHRSTDLVIPHTSGMLCISALLQDSNRVRVTRQGCTLLGNWNPAETAGRHFNTDQDRGCQQHEYGIPPETSLCPPNLSCNFRRRQLDTRVLQAVTQISFLFPQTARRSLCSAT